MPVIRYQLESVVKCLSCDITFSRKSTLKRHLLNKHNVDMDTTESVEERSRRTREFVIEPGYSYVEPVAPVDRPSSSPGPSSPEPTNDFMFEDEASYGGGRSIGSDIDEDRFRMYEDNERPNYEGGIMEFEPEEEESSTSSSESEEDVEES
ncbi:hypothetical protein BD770DRAFT_450083, partial [Pilaira anomala]